MGSKNRTTEEFIIAAKKKHGTIFSYDKVKYLDSKTPVEIICPKHGSFISSPKNHIVTKSGGCSACCIITTDDIIKKFTHIHGDKYDYSLVDYSKAKTPVIIICPTHGEFKQTPDSHIKGSRCPSCVSRLKITKEIFITRSNEIHNNKYDYSKIGNVLGKRVTIICPIHGEFEQLIHSHLGGRGCYKCSGKMNIGHEEFVRRAENIHGDKYDYTESVYKNGRTSVEIICRKHGKFTQIADKHLSGQGCPKCALQKHTSKAESIIEQYLRKTNISFSREHTFPDCKNKYVLRFDFYIQYNNKNVIIEYNGKQHYEASENWGGQKRLELTKINDSIKRDYLKKSNIPHLDIHFKDEKQIISILEEFLKQV